MKRHLDYENIDYIIREYLMLSDEYISLLDIDMLKENIKYIINKYNNVDYMLESDFELGLASDNYDDIKILENKNGLIIYKEESDK